MFGLIGGIAGAIEENSRQKKMQKQDKEEVYIDSLTENTIFKILKLNRIIKERF
jgi:hypothetical protein